MKQAKEKIAAAGAALAVAATCPAAAAFADYASTINEITGKGAGLLNTIGYALLTLIAALAFLAAAKEILPALFARERPEFSSKVKGAVVIVVICILASFLPLLINSLPELAGQGVNLGTVSQ